SNIVDVNFETRKGILPNGAPKGGFASNRIQRDPVTGAILSVTDANQNKGRFTDEGLDYEASYQLDSSIFGRGNFGTFSFTLNGNYLARYTAQNRQRVPGSKRVLDGHFVGPRRGALPKNRWYASLFYDLGGLDVGATVHFVGQYYDLELAGFNRKIREWTT